MAWSLEDALRQLGGGAPLEPPAAPSLLRSPGAPYPAPPRPDRLGGGTSVFDYEDALAGLQEHQQPSFGERALEAAGTGLGYLGAVVGAPKRATDWLMRQGAKHLYGIDLPDEATTGSVLRASLGLAPTEQSGYAERLAGRGVEFVGDLLDPTLRLLGPLGKAATGGALAERTLLRAGADIAPEAARALESAVSAGRFARPAEKALGASFAGLMTAGTLTEAKQTYETLREQGLSPKAAEEALGTGLSAWMATHALRHVRSPQDKFAAFQGYPQRPAAERVRPPGEPPLDLAAERGFLRPDIGAEERAAMARQAREFYAGAGGDVVRALRSSIAGNIPGEPRLAGGLPPLAGEGADLVTFSPAAAAAVGIRAPAPFARPPRTRLAAPPPPEELPLVLEEPRAPQEPAGATIAGLPDLTLVAPADRRAAADRRSGLQLLGEPERRRAARRAGADAAVQLGVGEDHPVVRQLVEAEERSRTDPLTGLGNKRAWEELQPTVGADDHVVILDGKRFKHINDTYGHDQGDRVLQAIGEAVEQHLGADSARMGGDEFGGVVRGASAEDAMARAQAMKDALATTPLQLQAPDGSTVELPGVEVHIGVGRDAASADQAANAAAASSRRGGRGELRPEAGEPHPAPAVPESAAAEPAVSGLPDRGLPPPQPELAAAAPPPAAAPPTPEILATAPEFAAWAAPKGVKASPEGIAAWLGEHPEATADQRAAARAALRPPRAAPAPPPPEELARSVAAEEARRTIPDAEADQALRDAVPLLERPGRAAVAAGYRGGIKEAYGLEGMTAEPRQIAAAIREDGDNPLYLEARERVRGMLADRGPAPAPPPPDMLGVMPEPPALPEVRPPAAEIPTTPAPRKKRTEAEIIAPKLAKMSDAELGRRAALYETRGDLHDALGLVRAEQERRRAPAAEEAPAGAAVAEEVAPEAPAQGPPAGHEKLADEVYARLQRGAGIRDNRELTELAKDAFGGTRGRGKYTPRDAYDALEAGVNRWLVEHGRRLLAEEPARALAELRDLLKRLPTQTDRTEEQLQLQQFSTPPTHALVAARAAGITPDDIVLEPSAGTGGLASFARAAGAELQLNELSPRRAAVLRSVLGDDRATYTSVDAEHAAALLKDQPQPTVVLMNPPFSATGGRVGFNASRFGARHIESALQRLAPGGRLVAIVGEGMRFPGAKGGGRRASGAAFQEWWARIMGEYNVRANVGLKGEEYGKYGTTFPNQILVIDKDGPTPGGTWAGRLRSVVTGDSLGLEDALARLEPVRRVAGAPGEGRAEAGAGPVVAGGERLERGAPGAVHGPAGAPLPGGDRAPRAARQPGPPEPGESARAGRRGSRQRTGGGPELAAPAGGVGPGDQPKAVEVAPARAADAPAVYERARRVEAPKAVDDQGTFVLYEPHISVGDVPAHPAEIVESAPMAVAQAPAATYQPQLPESLLRTGALSPLQYETPVYAGQAHEQRLPGGARRAMFNGDGTGVGKGRQNAAVILDNWNQGRRKAIWLSVSRDLIEDAKRDMKDIGAGHLPVRNLGDWKPGQDVDMEHGVVFVTYNTLVGAQKAAEGKEAVKRLDQLLKWAGDEPVIIFDEAHAAKNVVGAGIRGGGKAAAKGSQRGQAVVDLQGRVPNARIVYVSATGATEPRNMAYMTRLGLWGEGTPFKDFNAFMSEIKAAGVGAMEVVARDLKAMGLYLARQISYRGVEFGEVHHALAPQQRDMYDTSARAWQAVFKNIDKALETTGGASSPLARMAAKSQFWGSQQRFYSQLIAAMKIPTAIREADAALARGESVVFNLINTLETRTKDAVAQARLEERDLDDLDVGPKEALMGYLQKSFPTERYEEYTDPETGITSSRVVKDAQGNVVHDPEAVALRDAAMAEVARIALPEGPLDQIVNHYGAGRVAEISGRKKRLQVGAAGRREYVGRAPRGVPQTRTNIVEMAAFNAGDKRIAIVTPAGGTGISLHADRRFKNQQRRYFISLQLPWSADSLLQFYGRVNRSNQAVSPRFGLLSSDVGGERRFSSTAASRLESLGALSKGERRASGGGAIAKYNYDSEYGERAVEATLYELARNEVPDVDGPGALLRMGLVEERGDMPSKGDVADINRFLNRALALEVDEQNNVLDHFARRFEGEVRAAKESGKFDEGVAELEGKDAEVKERQVLKKTGEAETIHYAVDVTRPVKSVSWEAARREKKRTADEPASGVSASAEPQFVRNKKSGNVFLATPVAPRTDESGAVVQQYRLTGVRGGHGREDAARLFPPSWSREESRYEALPDEQAETLWNEQHGKTPKQERVTEHIIGGLLLPVWDRLRGVKGMEAAKVVRTVAKGGERVVGMLLPRNVADQVLRAVGAGVGAREPAQALTEVMSGAEVSLAGGHRLARRRVAGEERAEFIPKDRWTINPKELQRLGLIDETIAYQRRYFIPGGDEGPAVAAKLLERFPEITGEAGTRFATAPAFFSQLERVVTDPKAPKAGSGFEWRRYLADPKRAVKADEVKWTGLDDYLAERKGQKVTRQEIADFLAQNRVEVHEVTLGDVPDVDTSGWTAHRRGNSWLIQNSDGELQATLSTSTFGTNPEAGARAVEYAGRMAGRRAAATKFETYQIPGGENYRELLLTLPEKPGGRTVHGIDEEGREYARREGGQNFTAGHFDEPNVLAHVRFNERTDADGKRVLFIEELQSDWAQKGRRGGFRQAEPQHPETLPDDVILREYTNGLGEQRYQAVWKDGGGGAGGASAPTPQEAIQSFYHERYLDQQKAGVPTAPFVTKTEAWTELALKRMVRYAAENGFDRVAWTTGDQQAARYDLSKQVDTVTITRTLTRDGDKYDIDLVKNGMVLGDIQPRGVSLREVEDTVGKDLAEKAELQADRESKDYSGLDLKVGGEGMRGFYDQIVPQLMNKLGKKWGAKVGETGLGVPAYNKARSLGEAAAISDLGAKSFTAHSIDVTPEMRRSVVEQGQPLFAARSRGLGAPAITAATLADAFRGVEWRPEGDGFRARIRGADVVVRPDATITVTEGARRAFEASARAHGLEPGAAQPAAKTYTLDGRQIIEFARGAGRAEIDEEAFHVAMKLLPDDLRRGVLRRYGFDVRQEYAGQDRLALEIEAEERAAKAYREGPDQAAAGILGRVADWFRGLLRRLFPKMPGAVFERIRRGEFFGEKPGAALEAAPAFAPRARPAPGQRGLPGIAEDIAPAGPARRRAQQQDLFGAREMAQPTEANVTEGREREGPLFTQEREAEARREEERQTRFATAPAGTGAEEFFGVRPATEREPAGEPGERRRGKPPEYPINLDRIGVEQDVLQAETEVVDAMRERLGHETQTHEQTRQLALRSGLTEEEFVRLQKKHGALTAPHITAGRMLREEAAKAVDAAKDARDQVFRERGTGEQKLEAERQYEAAITRLGAVVEGTTRGGTEAARALEAHKIMSEGLLPGERFFDRLLRQHPAMRPGVRDRLLRAIKENDQRGIIEAAREAIRPSLMSKFLEFWKAGLVSGPPTIAGNAVSNTVFEGWRTGERGLAGVIDGILSKVQGREQERFASEAAAALMSVRTAVPQALKLLWNGHLEEKIKLGSKYEGHVGAIGGPLGRVVRLPFRSLQAFDDAAKHIAAQNELFATAWRMAMRDAKRDPGVAGKVPERMAEIIERVGKYGDAKLLRESGAELDAAATVALQDRASGLIWSQMDRAAHEATFQDQVGKITQAVLALRSAAKVFGFPIGDIVAPFVKTPSRILYQAGRRTPLGFLEAARVWRGVREGTATHGEFAEAVARPLLGTLLGIGLYAAAREGLITGSGPADDRKRKLLQATGWQPYSVKVGDSYVQFKRLEPLATVMGLAADLAEAPDEKTAGTLAEKLQGALIQNFTEKSWLTGFTSVAEAWNDPKRAGAAWLRQIEGSLVPNVVRKAAVAIDPEVRESRSALGPIAAGIPGVSTLLPARTRGTGEPIEREGTAVERFASPFPRSVEREGTDLERVLLDLDYAPSEIGRTLHIPGSKVQVELTPRERAFLQEQDRKTTERLRRVVESASWKRLDAETQREYVERAYAAGRRLGRERLYQLDSFRQRARQARAAAATMGA